MAYEDRIDWFGKLPPQIVETAEVLYRTAYVWDFETTGKSPGSTIVAAAAVRAWDGAVVYETLVRPMAGMEEGALAVHGLSARRLQRAPQWRTIWREVDALLRSHPAVTFNAEFDRDRLIDTCRAAGVAHGRYRWACLMKAYCGLYGKFMISLREACEREGVPYDEALAHSALYDAECARRLLSAVCLL
jgi:DNA polymerase III epsilon subunit-like protein